MDIKEEFAQCKKENGRFLKLIDYTFEKLEASQAKIGIVETALINSDESTERHIVELSSILNDIMTAIYNEVPGGKSIT